MFACALATRLAWRARSFSFCRPLAATSQLSPIEPSSKARGRQRRRPTSLARLGPAWPGLRVREPRVCLRWSERESRASVAQEANGEIMFNRFRSPPECAHLPPSSTNCGSFAAAASGARASLKRGRRFWLELDFAAGEQSIKPRASKVLP